MRMTDPPDEAYSRLTNPERLRPLHGFADSLVEILLATFEVGLVERDVALLWKGHALDLERSVRLTPVGGGAPIALGWTGLPGIYARFGDFATGEYPSCGCDACGDDAFELAEVLIGDVRLVTSGGFQEWVQDGFLCQGVPGGSRSGHSINPDDLPDGLTLDYASAWACWQHKPLW